MRFPVDGTQPIKIFILPDLPIFLEFTPKSILFTHQSWHITWFHNQCCRHEMICENFEIFENFLRILNFIKSVLTTEAVSPEAVLNSEPSKNTSEQLFFLSPSKIKDGVKFKFTHQQMFSVISISWSHQQPAGLNTHSRFLKSI